MSVQKVMDDGHRIWHKKQNSINIERAAASDSSEVKKSSENKQDKQ